MKLAPEDVGRIQRAWAARSDWDWHEALEVGRAVYEALAVDDRPRWAGRLLRLCLRQLPNAPAEVVHVADLADDQWRWREGHEAFRSVRELTLRVGKRSRSEPSALVLYVAENVAKITYNASGGSAPFDHDAGWWLLMNVRDFLAAVPPDPQLDDQLRAAVVNAA